MPTRQGTRKGTQKCACLYVWICGYAGRRIAYPNQSGILVTRPVHASSIDELKALQMIYRLVVHDYTPFGPTKKWHNCHGSDLPVGGSSIQAKP